MPDNEYLNVKKVTDKAFKLKQKNNYQQAREILEDALEKYPDNNFLKTSLADLFIKDNKQQDAENLIEEVLKDDPENYQALLCKGNLAYKKREYEKALEFFQQAYTIEEKPYIASRIIYSYFKLEKYQKALNYCQQWLERTEDDSRFLKLKALIHDKMGKSEDASSLYEDYLQKKDDDDFAYKQKLKLKLKDKSPDEAIKELRQLLRLSSKKDKAELYTLLAEKLEENDEYQEAVQEYKKALELNPGDEYILKNLGFSLVKMEKRKESLKYLKQACRQDPSDYYVCSSLEASFKRLNRHQEGIEFFKEVIKENPGYKKLWGRIKKLQKGLEDNEG